MKYKAIGFDYGGVVFGLPGSLHMLPVAELLDMPLDVLRKTFFESHQKVNIEKTMDWIELWKHISTILGHPEKHQAVVDLLEACDKNQKVNQDIIDLIGTLHTSGYKIGLLSNYGEGLRDRLNQQGIISNFNVIGISSEMGLMKPQKEAFLKFCNMLEVQPNELIYVDDTQRSLETAESVGYTPILYLDFDDLHNKLTDLKVI